MSLTAIILAGGESSRLRPLGDKSLQRFLGQTLLRRHLDQLVAAGAGRVIVVTSPRNDALIRAECAHLGERVVFASQPEPLGMGDAAARALALAPPDAPVYLTQAHDVFADVFHAQLIALAAAAPGTIHIAARLVSRYFPGGYLIPATDADTLSGQPFAVTGVVEKPGADREPSQWVTLVAHALPRAGDALAALEAAGGDPGDRYERALTALMARAPAQAVPHLAATAALKYPWHMLDIMDLLLGRIRRQQIDPAAWVAPLASVEGPVIVESGARVYPGAAIVGPAYIGRGTVVGNQTLVRGAMVGERCVLGFASEIARSWIGNDVWFHTNYVGDSVIDDDVAFGSGAVTSNLRLDGHTVRVHVKGELIDSGREKLGQIVGAGARVGINASLLPGVLIGRDALVGAGVVLNEDVPDRTRVLVQQTQVRTPNRRLPPPRGPRRWQAE